MQENLKILIFGSGAVGAFYGGKLSQGGAQVSVVCRSDYPVVKQKGYQIISPLGNFHFIPENVFSSQDHTQIEFDFLIIATKVLNPNQIVPIHSFLSSKTQIVLLQNGIDIEKPYLLEFPNHKIHSALAFVCIHRQFGAKIQHLDFGRLIIGRYPDQYDASLEPIQQILEQMGVYCKISENILYDRFVKLIWNAPFNPLSVILGGKNTQQILEQSEMIDLIRKMMKEVQFIAKNYDIIINDKVIDRNITDTLKMIPYEPSMLLDYRYQRPMEIEAILGNAIQLAKQKNLHVPYLETIYVLMKGLV